MDIPRQKTKTTLHITAPGLVWLLNLHSEAIQVRPQVQFRATSSEQAWQLLVHRRTQGSLVRDFEFQLVYVFESHTNFIAHTRPVCKHRDRDPRRGMLQPPPGQSHFAEREQEPVPGISSRILGMTYQDARYVIQNTTKPQIACMPTDSKPLRVRFEITSKPRRKAGQSDLKCSTAGIDHISLTTCCSCCDAEKLTEKNCLSDTRAVVAESKLLQVAEDVTAPGTPSLKWNVNNTTAISHEDRSSRKGWQ